MIDMNFKYNEESKIFIDMLLKTVPADTQNHAALQLFLSHERHNDALNRLVQLQEVEQLNSLTLFVIISNVEFEKIDCRLALFERLCVFTRACLSCRLKALSSTNLSTKVNDGNLGLLEFLNEFSVSMSSTHPIPFVLSPLNLVQKALDAHKRELAANLYWNISLLPINMLSPAKAMRRLEDDLDAKRLPFYFQKLEEVERSQIGWGASIWSR